MSTTISFMRNTSHSLFLSALAFGALTVPLVAQTLPLGSITGSVTDPSGKTVSEAGIRVIEIATNAERKLTSDQAGRFLAADLPLGTYSLYATHAGFQVTRIDGLALEAGRTLRADVELKIGATRETVVVTAAKNATRRCAHSTPPIGRPPRVTGRRLTSPLPREKPCRIWSYHVK